MRKVNSFDGFAIVVIGGEEYEHQEFCVSDYTVFDVINSKTTFNWVSQYSNNILDALLALQSIRFSFKDNDLKHTGIYVLKNDVILFDTGFNKGE